MQQTTSYLRMAVVLGWAALWPSLAEARDYVANAGEAVRKGDLKAAQLLLRNAVKEDPQGAEARYQLARVDLQLGDAAAAEKEANAARERGYDMYKLMPVLTQAYMTQGKFNDLLRDFPPGGSDPQLEGQILVARGYAQAALRDPRAATASFADAERLAPQALEPLMAQFRLAMARGDLDAAQGKMERALALDPTNPDAMLERVQLLHRRGDLAGALAAADALAAAAPSFLEGRMERATLMIATGQDEMARTEVAATLAALPNNPRALMLQALLEARRRDFKAADITLQKIAPVMASLPRAYFLMAYVKAQLGMWEQAEDAAQRYVGRVTDDVAGLKLLAGIEMQRQRPDKAVELLAKRAAAGAADPALFDLLGRAYAAQGRPEQATQAFARAAELAPEDAQMRGRLAASRLAMGDPTAAAEDLERALEIAPKQPQIGAALFFAELATGDLDRAADAVAKVRAAQGDTAVVQNLEGLLKLARLDLPGARAVFSRIVAAHPEFAPAQVNLARIAAMQGERDEALGLLAGILQKDPTSEPALGMLVAARAADGKAADAAALLQRAIAAAPADVRLVVGLADLHSRNGDGAKALALLTQDQGRLAASPALLGAEARAQIALGQSAEARNTYRQILALDPNALDARRRLVALLVQANELEAARNLVQEGLRSAPENVQLLADFIAIDKKAGGIDRALATADRLRSQVADSPSARALKGDVYMGEGRFEDAAQEFASQLRQAPSSVLALRLAGAKAQAGHPDQAIVGLRERLGKTPDDLPVIEALAGLELAQRDYAAAETHFKAILARKPRDPVALNNLAWLYQQRGLPDARSLAQQAYVLYPGGQTADTLGWILVKQGEAETALPLLRQASAQLAGNRDVTYHLAAALKDTGKRDEARNLLVALMDNKTDFDERANAQKLLDELSKG